MFADLIEAVSALPVWLVLVVATGMTLAETTLGLGLLVPGEAVLVAAAAAVVDLPTLALMLVLVSAAAVAGDVIGYTVGRAVGPRLRDSRIVRRLGPEHWDRATGAIARHGAWIVIGARFLPVLRTVVPATAGASGMAFRRFLPAVLVGAPAWSALHVLVGHAGREVALRFEDAFGVLGWVVLLVAAVVVGGVLLARRRSRRGRRRRPGPQRAVSAERCAK